MFLHFHAMHAYAVHAYAVHVHAAHGHVMHAHIIYGYVMYAHAVHGKFYVIIKSDMSTVVIVPKLVFHGFLVTCQHNY
jgi:hypothetical protein